MKLTTKISIIAAAAIGLVGIARLGYAESAISNAVAVLPPDKVQAARNLLAKETSDGDGETNDDQTAAQTVMQALAKITPQQAQQAAESSQSGKASRVQLENEDGNLVYAVQIGQKEVKVDAGTAKVLYVDDAKTEADESKRPRSSIQVPHTAGDGDGETNDDTMPRQR